VRHIVDGVDSGRVVRDEDAAPSDGFRHRADRKTSPRSFSGAGRRALSAGMSKRLDAIDAELSIPERILLFCVASRTEWDRAGVTGATVTVLVVRGLIERDVGGRFVLTKQGRAVLDAMVDGSWVDQPSRSSR
jgi:hypothetical protein